jgi:hypothetical protein
MSTKLILAQEGISPLLVRYVKTTVWLNMHALLNLYIVNSFETNNHVLCGKNVCQMVAQTTITVIIYCSSNVINLVWICRETTHKLLKVY